MKRTYTLFQKHIAYILLIVFFLQSCGSFNHPITPIEKEPAISIQTNAQASLPPTRMETLIGQELIAQGGHSITFHKQGGDLKADVVMSVPQGFSKTYKGINVYIEQEAELSSLPGLDKKAQEHRIHLQPARGKQLPKVIIYKGAGLMGGDEIEEESDDEEKEDKSKIKLTDKGSNEKKATQSFKRKRIGEGGDVSPGPTLIIEQSALQSSTPTTSTKRLKIHKGSEERISTATNSSPELQLQGANAISTKSERSNILGKAKEEKPTSGNRGKRKRETRNFQDLYEAILDNNENEVTDMLKSEEIITCLINEENWNIIEQLLEGENINHKIKGALFNAKKEKESKSTARRPRSQSLPDATASKKGKGQSEQKKARRQTKSDTPESIKASINDSGEKDKPQERQSEQKKARRQTKKYPEFEFKVILAYKTKFEKFLASKEFEDVSADIKRLLDEIMDNQPWIPKARGEVLTSHYMEFKGCISYPLVNKDNRDDNENRLVYQIDGTDPKNFTILELGTYAHGKHYAGQEKYKLGQVKLSKRQRTPISIDEVFRKKLNL